jgi:hypothetical protein
MLFVLYFATFICYGLIWQYGKSVVKAESTFEGVVSGIGLSLVIIASIGMTVFSAAGTVTAIQNGFYL